MASSESNHFTSRASSRQARSTVLAWSNGQSSITSPLNTEGLLIAEDESGGSNQTAMVVEIAEAKSEAGSGNLNANNAVRHRNFVQKFILFLFGVEVIRAARKTEAVPVQATGGAGTNSILFYFFIFILVCLFVCL
jgi:hypothetical protein